MKNGIVLVLFILLAVGGVETYRAYSQELIPPEVPPELQDEDDKPPVVVVPEYSVLLFTAEWCGPCRRIAKPEFEKFKKKEHSKEKPKYGCTLIPDSKVDMHRAYRIKAYPTYIFIRVKDKKILKRHEGALYEHEITDWLRGRKERTFQL